MSNTVNQYIEEVFVFTKKVPFVLGRNSLVKEYKLVVMLHGASGDMHSISLKSVSDSILSLDAAYMTLRFSHRSNLKGRTEVLHKVLKAIQDGSFFTKVNMEGCNVSEICLLGHSMGSRVIVNLLDNYEEYCSLVSKCIFQSYPLHPNGSTGEWRDTSMFKSISPRPFLFIVGTKDRFVNKQDLQQALEPYLEDEYLQITEIPLANHSLTSSKLPSIVCSFLE